MFKEIIGQKAAKRRAEFVVRGANSVRDNELTQKFQPLILVAPKGTGKTVLSRGIASELKDSNGESRKFIEVNGSDLKNSEAFVNRILRVACDSDDYFAIFIDEAQCINNDIQSKLLSTFEVSEKTSREYHHNGEVFEVNLKKVAFILATTNPEKFQDPFYERLRKISLKSYKNEEILEIVKDKVARVGLKASLQALKRLSLDSRQSPRTAVEMLDEMAMLYEVEQKQISLDMWTSHTFSMGFIPLGLTLGELKTLQSISKHGKIKLSGISAETGEPSLTVRKTHEPYLLRLGWIRVDGDRFVTPSGLKRLKYIESEMKAFA